jgi:hypothetical protein
MKLKEIIDIYKVCEFCKSTKINYSINPWLKNETYYNNPNDVTFDGIK